MRAYIYTRSNLPVFTSDRLLIRSQPQQHVYLPAPKLFTFDHSVGPDCSQETLFQMAGKPATRAIMQGYNGTVFCYGQVGPSVTPPLACRQRFECTTDGRHKGHQLHFLFLH